MSLDIETEISEFFETDESCLCDILILKSIFDIKYFQNTNSKGKWNGVIQKSDSFEFNLDFLSSRLAYYYWQPCFYLQFSNLSPISPIDLSISKILEKYEAESKKKLGTNLPKITFMCSNSTKNYREKIKSEIQKHGIVLKLSNKLNFIKFLPDDKLEIKKEILLKINESSLMLLDKIFRTFFLKLSYLLSDITIEKQKRPNDLPFLKFQKIQSIQESCFYCDNVEFNIQEHVMPIQLFGKSVESNIVASCNACNISKWHYLLSCEIFDKVLERNKLHSKIMEPNYDSILYEKIYELFKQGNRPMWNG